MSATTTSGKSKTTGKAAPSRPPSHVGAAHQNANGRVMTKPNTSANLVKSGNTSAKPLVQPKLTVGKPNDSFEQQADAMAQKVVSMTPADMQQVNGSRQSLGRQINPSAEKSPSRTALQKKNQPGSFLLQATSEKEKVSKKEDEKIKKKEDEKIKKKSEEKILKAPEPKLQQVKETIQPKPTPVQPKPIQAKEEEKLSKMETEKKKNSEEKVQKKADEKIQKSNKPSILASAEKLMAKLFPVQAKEDEKLQKMETEKKKNTEEKVQKKAEEKIMKAPEPKVLAKEVVQPKPAVVQTKPVQLKEEEKLRKMETEKKKNSEEKIQKKADEKIMKAPEPKVLAAKEVVQPKPVVVQTKPVQLKEEEKLRKMETEKKKNTEEKVQKKTEDKILKNDANNIQPVVQKSVAATVAPVAIQTKEEEKVHKASEEKIMKTAEASEPDHLSPEFEARLAGTMGGGTRMDATLLAYMESRFDVDFSAVRFHTDMTAIQLCNEAGAQAFAYKNHVYFNRGKYQPDTDSGRFLIAHELTHVIQQGYATQKGGAGGNAPPQPAAKAEEQVQTSPQNISSTSPRIQRIGWDTVNNAVRRVVPVWTLLTVIMGYNPILGQSVARNSVAWFQGLLDLIPIVGPSIFDKLQQSGMIARAQAWLDSVFADLPSYAEIRATWDRCWSEMGILHGIDGNIAIFQRHFNPIITRIRNFVTRVLNKVVEFLRETLLRPLDNVIKDIPGWELICTLIGSNPLTGEAKQRTAMNVLRGVVAFIPGGQEKLDQLVQSHALERAYQWFIAETTARNLTWPRIQATFTQAWNTLSANDILHPIDTFNRLRGIFSPLLSDLGSFALAALEKLLELIFEAMMGAGGAQVLAVLKRARNTFVTIIRDPVRFLGNLMRGVGQGIRQFGTNILTHLRDGVIAWLTGPIAAQGIQMPERWDLRGFIWFGLQILGLTWDRVRTRMVNILGQPVVTALETGFEIVMEIRQRGIVQALRDRVSQFFGGMRDMLLNRIKSFITERIVTAGIQQLVALLSPVGAVLDAIVKTYNTIMFFIDNIRRIVAFVNSVLDSVEAIANGNLGQAANFIENTMARTIPILLDFLARFLGLGNVAARVRTAIEAIQNWVGEKLDLVINWIRTQAVNLIQAGRDAAGRIMNWWRTRKEFRTRTGENHALYFEGEGASAELIMASRPMPIGVYLSRKRTEYTRLSSSTTQTVADDANRKLAQIGRAETIVANLRTITRATTNATQATTITNAINALSEAMMEIANDTTNVPLPTPSEPTFGGGSRKYSQVDKLSTATSTGGEAAADPSSPNGWARIKANKLTDADKGQYVRMHMISAAYGGKNNNNNLIPAPHAINTGSQVVSFENAVKRLVENPDGITHKPNVLWVKTQVTGFHPADRTNPNRMHRYTGLDYPSGVTMEAGLYYNIPDAPFWRRDNQARVSETVGIGPPDYTKAGKVAIYSDGEPAIQEATGCSYAFAREICLAKLHGKPTTVSGFQLLMENHWDNVIHTRRGVPFADNLQLVIDALNAGTVTYN